MNKTSEDIEALLALLGFRRMRHLSAPHRVWLCGTDPYIQVTPEGCYIESKNHKVSHDEAWDHIVKLHSGDQTNA